MEKLDADDGDWVKVYGSMRSFKERRAIAGQNIYKLEDYNELTNHYLQVFTNHCIRLRGVLTEEEIKESFHAMRIAADQHIVPQQRSRASHQVTTFELQDTEDEATSSPQNIDNEKLKEAILRVMNDLQEQKPQVTRDEILRSMRVKPAGKQFDGAISSLIEEMVIYSNDGNQTFTLV